MVGLATTALRRVLLQKHNWCVLTEGGADAKRSRSGTNRHPVESRLDPGFPCMYFGFQKLSWNAAQSLRNAPSEYLDYLVFMGKPESYPDIEVLIFAQP